MYVRKPSLIHF